MQVWHEDGGQVDATAKSTLFNGLHRGKVDCAGKPRPRKCIHAYRHHAGQLDSGYIFEASTVIFWDFRWRPYEEPIVLGARSEHVWPTTVVADIRLFLYFGTGAASAIGRMEQARALLELRDGDDARVAELLVTQAEASDTDIHKVFRRFLHVANGSVALARRAIAASGGDLSTAVDFVINQAKVAIDPAVERISDGEFEHSGLAGSITLRAVRALGARAFAESTQITEVRLPELEAIGDEAFAGCSNLRYIYVPKLAKFGSDTFTGCDAELVIDLGARPYYPNQWGYAAASPGMKVQTHLHTANAEYTFQITGNPEANPREWVFPDIIRATVPVNLFDGSMFTVTIDEHVPDLRTAVLQDPDIIAQYPMLATDDPWYFWCASYTPDGDYTIRRTKQLTFSAGELQDLEGDKPLELLIVFGQLADDQSSDESAMVESAFVDLCQ